MFNFSDLNMESQFFESSDVFGSDEDKDMDTNDEYDEHFLQFIRYLISSSVIIVALFVILVAVHILKRGNVQKFLLLIYYVGLLTLLPFSSGSICSKGSLICFNGVNTLGSFFI